MYNNNNNLSVSTFNTIIFLTDELIIAPLFKHLLLSHYDYQLNLFIWWDASHLGNHYSLPTPASLNCKLKQTNTRRGHNEKCEQKQKRHEWEERWKGLKRGSGKWQVEVQVMEMEKEKADSVRVIALWGEAGLLANRRRGWANYSAAGKTVISRSSPHSSDEWVISKPKISCVLISTQIWRKCLKPLFLRLWIWNHVFWFCIAKDLLLI